MDDIETDNWAEKVEDLLWRCERKSIASSELVREVHDILAGGPSRICADIRPQISDSTLQLLLEAGAAESAALRLVEKCGFMLSHDGRGLFIATVVLPAAGREYSFSASSGAFAIGGALATALQESL